MRLIKRGGHNWSDRYPWIVEAPREVRKKRFVLDGEAVVLPGIPNPNALRKPFHRSHDVVRKPTRRSISALVRRGVRLCPGFSISFFRTTSVYFLLVSSSSQRVRRPSQPEFSTWSPLKVEKASARQRWQHRHLNRSRSSTSPKERPPNLFANCTGTEFIGSPDRAIRLLRPTALRVRPRPQLRPLQRRR